MSNKKDEKAIYFTVEEKTYSDMKIFCAKYGFSVKDFLTKVIELSIDAEKRLTKES